MQICVLSDTPLNSIAEWQEAINAERFPLRLSLDRPLNEVSGFLPALLENKATGFECHHVKSTELTETYPDVDFHQEWRYVLAFVWGGNFEEMRATWMAAVSYARATAGVVFDEEAGKVLTALEAFQVVQDMRRRHAAI